MRVLSLSLLLLSGFLAQSSAFADPVVAFSNIPPPAIYKVGGSSISASDWKALLFTTPASSTTQIVSIKVGLTDCQNTCGHSLPETYPVAVDFQLCLYSVSDQAGVLTPDTELYSIPMQYGLILTQRGTEFTFEIPNWPMAANTTYALVGKGTNTRKSKWSNVDLGSVGTDYPPQPQNGFLFQVNPGFGTSPAPTWVSSGAATNNAVEMKVVFVSSVPTLSEWALLVLAILLVAVGCRFDYAKRIA